MTKYLNLIVAIGLFASIAFSQPWAAVFVYFVFTADECFQRWFAGRNNTNLQRLDAMEKEIKGLVAAQNMRNKF